MQYSQLIARIQADIYNNGAELITGDILQGDLLAIISALASAGAGYGGIITPDSSAPASLDQATFYIAIQPGTYSSFGVTVTEPSIVSYGGGASLTFTVSPLGLAAAPTVVKLFTGDNQYVVVPLTGTDGMAFTVDIEGGYSGGSMEVYAQQWLVNYSVSNGATIYVTGDKVSTGMIAWARVYESDGGYFLVLNVNTSDLDYVTMAFRDMTGDPVPGVTSVASIADYTYSSDAVIIETEYQNNKVTTISAASSDIQYPSAKAVYQLSQKLTDLSPDGKFGYKRIVDDTNLTAAMVADWANCIVEICAKITVPSGTAITFPDSPVVLYFNGGSIDFTSATSSFYPKGAFIVSAPYQIFYGQIPQYVDNDTKYFKAEIAYPEWAGAKGDGTNDDAPAFNFLRQNIKCNGIHLVPGKNYNTESNIVLRSNLFGSGATIQRSRTWVDLPLTAAPTINTNDVTCTVDTSSPSYANLKVGMGVCLVNQTGGISSFSTRNLLLIYSISGSTVVLKRDNGSTISISYTGGTPSTYAIVNLYTVLSISGHITIDSVNFDLGRTIIDESRMYRWQPLVGVDVTSDTATVRDCKFENAIGDALVVYTRDCLIQHNFFAHCGSNALHLSGSYGAVVKDNFFFDTNLISSVLHNEGNITFSNSVYNTIIHGNIFDTGRNGIGSLDSADNCKVTITDNVFVYFRENGIQGICAVSTFGSVFRDYVIKGNRFYGTVDDTIANEASHELTPVATRVDATGYGVSLAPSNSGYWLGIVICGNEFFDCGVYLGNSAVSTVNSNNFIYHHTFTGSHPDYVVNLKQSRANVNGNFFDVASPGIEEIISADKTVNISNNIYRAGIVLTSSETATVQNNISTIPTIKFNQVAGVPYGSSETYGDLTVTKNADNTFTFNGSMDDSRSGIFSLPFDFVSGHIYYFRSGNAKVQIYNTSNWGHGANYFLNVVTGATNKRLQFWVEPNTFNNDLAAMQAFDLTLMFGTNDALFAQFGISGITSGGSYPDIVAAMADAYPNIFYAQNVGEEVLNPFD